MITWMQYRKYRYTPSQHIIFKAFIFRTQTVYPKKKGYMHILQHVSEKSLISMRLAFIS
jgi:hypothetical protein